MKVIEIGVESYGRGTSGTFRSIARVKLDDHTQHDATGFGGTQELASDDAFLNLINRLFDKSP